MLAKNNTKLCASDHSDQGVELFHQLVSGFLTTIVISLGLVGNTNSMIFLRRVKIERSLAAVLGALAFWDSVLLIGTSWYYSLGAVCAFWDYQWPWHNASLYLKPLVSIASTASVWLVIATTVQRYNIVRGPFAQQTMRASMHARQPYRRSTSQSRLTRCIQRLKACKLAICVSLASAFSNATIFFDSTLERCFCEGTMQVSSQIVPTTLGYSKLYRALRRVIGDLLINSLGPVLIAISLTILTELKLKDAKTNRKSMVRRSSSKSIRQRNTAKCQRVIAFVLAVKFLLLHSVPTALTVWENIFASSTTPVYYDYIVEICKFLIVLNSATNSLVYLRGRQLLYTHLQNKWERKRQFKLLYTTKSARHLSLVWRRLQNNCSEDFGWALSQQILREVADSQSYLHLNLSREHGFQMTRFLGQVIHDLDTQLVGADCVRAYMRRAGEAHASTAISRDFWRQFKHTLLEQVEVACADSRDQEKTMDNWNRLISLMIAEMKAGMVANRPNDHRLSVVSMASGYSDPKASICSATMF